MSAELYARAKELFLVACKLPPDQRGSFLDQHCTESRLRREVESLLAQHCEVGDETGASASSWSGPPRQAEPRVHTIDNYRVLQRIGKGGMGEVYAADQESPVQRRVAVKIIKWGMDTEEVISRFEGERQALALMNHPNIARIFEAGTTRQGRPYFAMELIDGPPITEYCDTHRLSTRERLQLFARVCHGVQHAHQKGVIHRDVKPTNVLVATEDGRPVPKIIDFGVAKATVRPLIERGVSTELGRWIGTPEYMSPEQVGLTGSDVDTRSDVYSLGVLLYELLVGALPFDPHDLWQAGFEEMRRWIREEEPSRPSVRLTTLDSSFGETARNRRTDLPTLARQLRGDLDWITMRALEKDKNRRYGSPSELVADIERHLNNEPVLASPPSNIYRSRKFVRRHRLGVTMAVVVLAVLLTGITGTMVGLVQARREAESARSVSEFVVRLFQELDPGAITGHASTPEEILDRGAQRIDTELRGQPLVQARLKGELGIAYLGMGQFERSRHLLESALETRRRLLGTAHPDFATSLRDLAWLLGVVGDTDSAHQLNKQALAIRERAFGPESLEVALSARDLGRTFARKGKYAEAESSYQRALELQLRLLATDDFDLLLTRQALADLWTLSGDYERARPLLEQALASNSRAYGLDHPQTGWCMNVLGWLLYLTGNYSEAESLLRRALIIQQQSFGPDHMTVALPLIRLGTVYESLGRCNEAIPLFERARDIGERAYGPESADVMWSVAELASCRDIAGDPDESRRLLERALKIALSLHPRGHVNEGWILLRLAWSVAGTDGPSQALPMAERSLEILENTLGADHPELVWPLVNLGAILVEAGETATARPLIERGVAIRERVFGTAHPFRADDLHTLARLNHREGNHREAARLYERATGMTEERFGPAHPWIVRNLQDYAELLRAIGQDRRATEMELRAESAAQPR